MTTATENPVRHNHRTDDIRTALGHGIMGTEQALERARTLAQRIAAALPADPEQRPDTEKVSALTRETADTWEWVRTMTDGAPSARRRSYFEQQQLDDAAREHAPDDPEYLTKVAESAQRAASEITIMWAGLMLGQRAAGAVCTMADANAQ